MFDSFALNYYLKNSTKHKNKYKFGNKFRNSNNRNLNNRMTLKKMDPNCIQQKHERRDRYKTPQNLNLSNQKTHKINRLNKNIKKQSGPIL